MNLLLKSSVLLLGLLLSRAMILADGGKVQLQQQAGPFVITLFSEPTPVRVGDVDLSILCQYSANRSAVKRAQVLLYLRKPGSGDITEYILPVRASKSNAELYTVTAKLPSAGRWPVRVSVKQGQDQATVSGAVTVLPPQPAILTYWPFFLCVPLMALLFAINLRLRRRRIRR